MERPAAIFTQQSEYRLRDGDFLPSRLSRNGHRLPGLSAFLGTDECKDVVEALNDIGDIRRNPILLVAKRTQFIS